MSKTLIRNVRLAGSEDANNYVLIDGDKISQIASSPQPLKGGSPLPHADVMIDGHGALLMPGAIDCHVHMREPGMTEKADIASESLAAAAGGVTSYIEMPNTKPATTTVELWQQKMEIAERSSMVNYSFMIGATNDNLDQLLRADYSRVPAVKLFMGSSTGNMLVDDASTISRIFSEVDAIVAVHAEDQSIIDRNMECFNELIEMNGGDLPVEMHSHIRSHAACYSSTLTAVRLALRHQRRLHICHLTTAVELSLLQQGDPATKLITSEVSPHHLMWDTDDYRRCGTRIKMNPAIKDASDRHALSAALIDGLIDIVATDHAPHLLSQKQGGALRAVSGAPLVQFSLPWMLSNYDEQTVQRTMCENPAKVYHIDRRGTLAAGQYADLVLVERTDPYFVTDTDVVSKCGWTPLSMRQSLTYRVRQTWVNGVCVWRDGKPTGANAARAMRFTPGSRDAHK